MIRRYFYFSCFFLFCMNNAIAEDNNKDGEAQQLSGTSIVGNSEAPKSLTIIPWRDAEIGKEVQLTPSSLNEKLGPLNRDVLARELNLYKLSNPNQ